MSERADLVEAVEDRVLRASGGTEFPFPAVLRLRSMVFVPFRRDHAITRRALIARDDGRCQKSGCGRRGATMDHLQPRSRGGEHTWHNVVLMCQEHNNQKGDRTLDELGWTLKTPPSVPDSRILLLDRHNVRPQWRRWIPDAA